MIYFISDSFSPGTPGENRFDGLCKGIVHQGYAVTRVFLRPNMQHQRANDTFSGIEYRYLWEDKTLSNGKWRHIQQIHWLCLFLRSIHEEDRIVVTNSDYLFVYSWFPKLHIYHEKSEYPELHLESTPRLLRWIHKSYLRTCRRIDGLFPISLALQEYFVSKGVLRERTQVVNMTVDPSRFSNLKKEPVAERYIAYCGAVSNYKDGVDVLIKAFSIVSKHIADIKLFIIGDFPFQKDKEEDFALVESLGLTEKVVFTGPIPREAMPQLLKNAETLVLARPDNVQAKYGFPTKLGEYLLTENPVVLTSVGDIPLFLKDGENAYIALPGDVEEIASKIIESLTSPEAKNVGEMGAKVALQHFNSEIEAKKITDFIYGKR